jgi:hypothetical protein
MIAARQFSGIKKWRSTKSRTQTSKGMCARNNAFLEAGGQFDEILIRKNGRTVLEQRMV